MIIDFRPTAVSHAFVERDGTGTSMANIVPKPTVTLLCQETSCSAVALLSTKMESAVLLTGSVQHRSQLTHNLPKLKLPSRMQTNVFCQKTKVPVRWQKKCGISMLVQGSVKLSILEVVKEMKTGLRPRKSVKGFVKTLCQLKAEVLLVIRKRLLEDAEDSKRSSTTTLCQVSAMSSSTLDVRAMTTGLTVLMSVKLPAM